MVNITYDLFPTLFFTSYDDPADLDKLPIGSDTNGELTYSAELLNLFGTICHLKKNDSSMSHKNFLISDRICRQMESSIVFTEINFNNFHHKLVKPQTGTILVVDGTQYSFSLFSKENTWEALSIPNGRYIAAASLKGNVFKCYEEAVIVEGQLILKESTAYLGKNLESQGVSKGDMLKNIIAILSYIDGRDLPVISNSLNRTSETIHSVE